MNKYQKAIKRLKTDIDRSSCEYNIDEYIATLQELVDKETPMKVTEKWSDDCPKCNKFMIDTCEYALHNIPFIKYCPHCGQKLDWSDTYE